MNREVSIGDCCRSCGKRFIDHLGLIGTCQRLQETLAILREIKQKTRSESIKKLCDSGLKG